MEPGKKALLFIFIGIPGLFVFLGSLFSLFTELIQQGGIDYIRVALFIMGIPAGAFAILAGVGELRRWMYLLVVFSFPISFLLLGVVAEKLNCGLFFILIGSGMVSGAVYLAVEHHYSKSR